MQSSIFHRNLRVLFAAILLFTSIAVQMPSHIVASAQQDCSPTPYTATGNNAAAIEDDVNAFRDAIGELNAPHPINHVDGRRQINWDAAPDAVSAPNDFSGGFFNFNSFPRARGIEFTTSGTGFQLSATAASEAGIEFDNIDTTYSSEFTTFSEERLFTPVGSNTVDVRFFSPADQTTPALVDSLGVVFTDVDQADVTKMEFYGVNDALIYTLNAPATAGSETLSLAGVKFSAPCVSWVRITAGTVGLGAGINEASTTYNYDLVAMDDFIYGEPQPITGCGTPTVYGATGDNPATIQSTIDDYRTALGDLNAPAPFNNLDGRRQINWDAAPDGISAPNAFPGNFFNADIFPRARGIAFSTEGTDLQLSATTASNEGIEFSNINPNYSSIFQTFSAERLFTPIGSNVVRGDFFNPAQQTTPGFVDGFGAVFTDVDLDAKTTIAYYDAAGKLLYKQGVQANQGDEGLSFAGVKFDTNCVSFVTLTNGTAALGADVNDDPDNDIDLVVMDDFIYGEPLSNTVCGMPEIFTASGAEAAAIETTVNDYRNALGDLNPFEPQNFDTGRRQINWDAAPDTISAPNVFPGKFFNFNASPRARGIEFTTNGSNLQLSATEASTEGIEFSNIDPSYSATFNTFSTERLFSPIGSNEVDAWFMDPATQTGTALTNGFGAVFSDVDLANVTALRYYDSDNKLVYAQSVPAIVSEDGNNQETLSFAGLKFAEPCVARVRLINGNTAIAASVVDDPANGTDLVVMDDFIYGEPQPSQTNINALINLIRVSGSLNPAAQENAPSGVFTISAEFKNVGDTPVKNLSFVVSELGNDNVLLNTTNGIQGVGASFALDTGALGEDAMLTASESFNVDFAIGLKKLKSFTLLINAFGGIGADSTSSESLGWNYLMDSNPEAAALSDGGQSLYLPVVYR